MAMAVWQGNIVDESGNIQPNALIQVRRHISGLPPAVVYADRGGTVSKGSQFNADADGFVRFFAPGGAYQITATLGVFSRTWEYVAIGLAAEGDLSFFVIIDYLDSEGELPTSGEAGTAYFVGNELWVWTELSGWANIGRMQGPAGPAGITGSGEWSFDDGTTDADPGAGNLRWNHVDFLSATKLFISDRNAGNSDVSDWLDNWGTVGVSARRGEVHIYSRENPLTTWARATVTGSVTDDGGYRDINITPIGIRGVFADEDEILVAFVPAGPQGAGDVTGAGASVNNELAAFSGTGGDVLKQSGILIADALTRQGNKTLIGGFDSTSTPLEIDSAGEVQLAFLENNLCRYTNDSAHDLLAPSGEGTMIVRIENESTAGAITPSGFDLVDGDAFDTTEDSVFHCYIASIGGDVTLTVKKVA